MIFIIANWLLHNVHYESAVWFIYCFFVGEQEHSIGIIECSHLHIILWNIYWKKKGRKCIKYSFICQLALFFFSRFQCSKTKNKFKWKIYIDFSEQLCEKRLVKTKNEVFLHGDHSILLISNINYAIQYHVHNRWHIE